MKNDVNINEVLEVINEVERDAAEYIGHVAEVVCYKIRIGVAGLRNSSGSVKTPAYTKDSVYLDDVVAALYDCFAHGSVDYSETEHATVLSFLYDAKAAINNLPKVTISYAEGDK